MRLPIRTRLTLIFAALMLTTLALVGVFVYRAFAAELDRGLDERLSGFARELAGDLEDGETGVLHDFGRGDSQGFFAQVLGRDGSIVESVGAGAQPLLNLVHVTAPGSGSYSNFDLQISHRAPAVPVRVATAPATGGQLVAVGTSLVTRNATLEQLTRLLALAGAALALVVSVLTWLLAGSALRPVEALRRQASQITEGDLSERLPVPETGDELATLATTLNDLLARLERAFEHERRFVDDASHELRTPLGILKTELDLALRRSRTKEELEAAILSASEESERLNRIAEDLLVLARTDRGRLPLRKVPLQAESLVRRVADRFRHQADQQGIRLDAAAPPGLGAAGDPARLEQALGNLIANALAHTPTGGHIAVAATANGNGELVLSVSDSGPGFPEAFIGKAFDPFTRADIGRSRRDGGAGLGLAIVKGVAEAHGGSAVASNRPNGGAIVAMRIPI